MPNAIVRANAQTMSIDRRSALGGLAAAAGAMLAAPIAGLAQQSDTLSDFIALHRKA